jgi:hypothetical protein
VRERSVLCRHRISCHAQKLGHELFRAVELDEGRPELSLVTARSASSFAISASNISILALSALVR